jgi:hypothetical protein
MVAKDDEKHAAEPGNPKNPKNLKNLRNQGDIENKITSTFKKSGAKIKIPEYIEYKATFSRSFGATFFKGG